MEKRIGNSPDSTAERVYRQWDAALASRDLEASLALYQADATLESPLVAHLLGRERAICSGKEDLRRFIRVVFDHQPAERRHFRTGFFSDGRTLMWEYPRATPEGDQMDFVEVMELRDGLIQRHRVYWGWFGVDLMKRERIRR